MDKPTAFGYTGNLLVILAIALLSGQCSSRKGSHKMDEETYQTKDFTDSVFTSGIEGRR